MGTGGYPESRVLNGLEFGYCRKGGVGEPDWGCIGDQGFHRDLKVVIRVSLCWPQLEPARDFIMLSRGRALSHTVLMRGVKVK